MGWARVNILYMEVDGVRVIGYCGFVFVGGVMIDDMFSLGA